VPSRMYRRRVLEDRITYFGLDVHKDGIVVALAEGGLHGEVSGLWPDREHAGGFATAGMREGAFVPLLDICAECRAGR